MNKDLGNVITSTSSSEDTRLVKSPKLCVLGGL